jgi:hypothetical protein
VLRGWSVRWAPTTAISIVLVVAMVEWVEGRAGLLVCGKDRCSCLGSVVVPRLI